MEEDDDLNYSGLLLRFMGGTGMHGLPNIVNGKGIVRKIFWTLLLLGGLGLLVVGIQDAVIKYYTYPTNTDLRIDIDTPTTMPAITFCNLNPMKNKNMKHFPALDSKVGDSKFGGDKLLDDLRDADKENDSKFGWDNVGKDERPPEMDNLRTFVDTFMEMSETQRTEMGYKFNDLIVECTYKGKYCRPENFVRFLNPFYGNCYTFNANGTEKVHRSGASNAFALSFFIDQKSYVPDLAQSAGVRVQVHQPHEAPLPEDFDISLFPGTLTQVGMRRKVIFKTTKPYGTCFDYSEAEQKLRNAYMHTLPDLNKINYTQQACYKTCAQNLTLEMCGCMNPYLPAGNNSAIPGTKPFCKLSNETSRNCMDGTVQDSAKACGPRSAQGSCVEECTSSTYSLKTSASLWPSDKQLAPFVSRIMHRNREIMKAMRLMSSDFGKLKGFCRENFARVEIYFEDLNYDVLRITPGYTVIDLLADFGGQVGLWLGLSALTIFEVVELLADVFFLCFRKQQAKMLQKKVAAAESTEREKAKEAEAFEKTAPPAAYFQQESFEEGLKRKQREEALREINQAWY